MTTSRSAVTTSRSAVTTSRSAVTASRSAAVRPSVWTGVHRGQVAQAGQVRSADGRGLPCVVKVIVGDLSSSGRDQAEDRMLWRFFHIFSCKTKFLLESQTALRFLKVLGSFS